MKRISIFLILVALIAGMAGCGDSQSLEIWTWYDLDAIRDNLDGDYTLMNDLDSTTAGYTELASPTANGGKGWQPIGDFNYTFTGSFDGQGYEIRDLFIDRPGEYDVGLFGIVGEGGIIENVGVVNGSVTCQSGGGLVGWNSGTVSNSYSTGSVTGNLNVGGLMGCNYNIGTVSNSYSTGSVTCDVTGAGGLLGVNSRGTVSNSYSTATVTGGGVLGGLLGNNMEGTVSNSYSTGSVTGDFGVGGLVGFNEGTVSNSYSTGSVTGNGEVGGLVGLNSYDSTVSNSYSTGNVTGEEYVGGLVGYNYDGTISNSYSTGSVTGEEYVGGLVGLIAYDGTVSNSYSTGFVTGNSYVGGLVGDDNDEGGVSNSFWDTQTSGQAISDGGTGKTTAEMKDIATFSGSTWDIIAVANPSTRNPSYIWNIVDSETYPFLGWQP